MKERRFGDIDVGDTFIYAGKTLVKKSDTEAETIDGSNLFLFESRNMVRQNDQKHESQGNGCLDALYKTINGTLIAAFSICARTLDSLKNAATVVMESYQTANQIKNYSVIVDLYQSGNKDMFLIKVFYENQIGNSFVISKSL